jgi:hypothetical protein
MGLSMEFVAAHSEKRTDRTHKLSFGHVEATIHKAEQLRTSTGTRAPVRISLYCDQAQDAHVWCWRQAELQRVDGVSAVASSHCFQPSE